MSQPLQLGALSLSPPKPYSQPRVKEDRAAYMVSGRGFYDQYCKLWQPGQALYFDGEPNLDLIPLNKIAYDTMQAFLDKLDALGMKRAKKDGKDYIPLARQEWKENGEYDELPMPEYVMGMKIEGSNEAVR